MPGRVGGMQRASFGVGHRQQIGSGGVKEGTGRHGIKDVRVDGLQPQFILTAQLNAQSRMPLR